MYQFRRFGGVAMLDIPRFHAIGKHERNGTEMDAVSGLILDANSAKDGYGEW
jgi:hypothetical protein